MSIWNVAHDVLWCRRGLLSFVRTLTVECALECRLCRWSGHPETEDSAAVSWWSPLDSHVLKFSIHRFCGMNIIAYFTLDCWFCLSFAPLSPCPSLKLSSTACFSGAFPPLRLAYHAPQSLSCLHSPPRRLYSCSRKLSSPSRPPPPSRLPVSRRRHPCILCSAPPLFLTHARGTRSNASTNTNRLPSSPCLYIHLCARRRFYALQALDLSIYRPPPSRLKGEQGTARSPGTFRMGSKARFYEIDHQYFLRNSRLLPLQFSHVVETAVYAT